MSSGAVTSPRIPALLIRPSGRPVRAVSGPPRRPTRRRSRPAARRRHRAGRRPCGRPLDCLPGLDQLACHLVAEAPVAAGDQCSHHAFLLVNIHVGAAWTCPREAPTGLARNGGLPGALRLPTARRTLVPAGLQPDGARPGAGIPPGRSSSRHGAGWSAHASEVAETDADLLLADLCITWWRTTCMRSRSALPRAPSGRGLSARRSTAVNTCRSPSGSSCLGEGAALQAAKPVGTMLPPAAAVVGHRHPLRQNRRVQPGSRNPHHPGVSPAYG